MRADIMASQSMSSPSSIINTGHTSSINTGHTSSILDYLGLTTDASINLTLRAQDELAVNNGANLTIYAQDNLTSYPVYENYEYMYYNTDYGYIKDFKQFAHAMVFRPYIILGLIISVVSLIANVISIIAVCRIRKSWTSQLRIVISLMASDILVDTSFMAHIINSAHNPLYTPGTGPDHVMRTSRCMYMFLKALNTTGLNITLLNILVMAVDHYIAILKPLKMHRLMSKKRCKFTIVTIWVIAFMTGFSDFASPLLDRRVWTIIQPGFNYCEVAYYTHFQEEFITFCISFICFSSMTVLYLRIYCNIRRKHPRNIVHNKSLANMKALVTTWLILGTFILCWLPLCIFNIVIIICKFGGFLQEEIYINYSVLINVDKYFYCLMLFNTLCDPIIYAVRVREIRQSYIELWEKVRYGDPTDIASFDGATSRRCSSQASWTYRFAPIAANRRQSSDARLEMVPEISVLDKEAIDRLLRKASC